MKKKLKYLAIPAAIIVNSFLMCVFSHSIFEFAPFTQIYGAVRIVINDHTTIGAVWICILSAVILAAAFALSVYSVRLITALFRRLTVKKRAILTSALTAFFLLSCAALYAGILNGIFSGYLFESYRLDLICNIFFICLSCLLFAAASGLYQLLSFWKKRSEKSFRICCTVICLSAALASVFVAISFVINAQRDSNNWYGGHRIYPLYAGIALFAVFALFSCLYAAVCIVRKKSGKTWVKYCAVCLLVFSFIVPLFAGATQYDGPIYRCYDYGDEAPDFMYNPVDVAAISLGMVRLGYTDKLWVCARHQSSGRILYVARDDVYHYDDDGIFGEGGECEIHYKNGIKYNVIGEDIMGFQVYVMEPIN